MAELRECLLSNDGVHDRSTSHCILLDKMIQAAPDCLELQLLRCLALYTDGKLEDASSCVRQILGRAKSFKPESYAYFRHLISECFFIREDAAEWFLSKVDAGETDLLLQLSIDALRREYKWVNVDRVITLLLDIADNKLKKEDTVRALDVLEAAETLGQPRYAHPWVYRGQLIKARALFKSGLRFKARVYLEHYQSNTIGSPSSVDPVLTVGSLGIGKAASQYIWPSLMSRVDFRRYSASYDPDQALATFRNSKVLSGVASGSYFQFPIDENGKIYLDEYNLHPRYFEGLEGSPILACNQEGDQLLAELGHYQSTEYHKGLYVLLGGAPNYYHWLFEYIPRILALDLEQFDAVIVNHDVTEFQLDALRLLSGSTGFRLHKLKAHCIPTFEHLVAPTIRPIAQAAQSLASRASLLQHNVQRSRMRLFISRSDGDPRRIRIRGEKVLFETVLRPLGFKLVRLAELPVLTQISLFRNAEIIVAAHGAGLSNIVFAPADCTIIEINNRTNATYSFFEEVATVREQNFVRLICDSDRSSATNPEDDEAIVDQSQLNMTLNRLMQRRL